MTFFHDGREVEFIEEETIKVNSRFEGLTSETWYTYHFKDGTTVETWVHPPVHLWEILRKKEKDSK